MRTVSWEWLRHLAVAASLINVAAAAGVTATKNRPAKKKTAAKPAAAPASKRPRTANPAPPAASREALLRAAPLPPGPGKAPIEWPGTEFILRLAGDISGQQHVESKGGIARITPGEYWLTGWKVTVPDPQGRRWTARGGVMGAPSMNARLLLRAGQTRPVPLGGPLGVALTPVVQGRTAMFTMTFVGPLGDRCYEVSVDGKRPPNPTLTIYNEKGEVVDKTLYPFGCSFMCRHSWRAPEGVSGKLRAVVEADWGPFFLTPGPGVTFEIAANASDEDPVSVGRPGPEFTLVEPEKAGSLTLSSLRGKPVVLNFFCGCSWCEDVAAMWAKRPLPDGVELIAIWNDVETATPAALRKFRARTGFAGRILSDPDHVATLAYRSGECPKVWVLDASGTIRHVNASRTEPAERIVSEATAAVKPGPVAAADTIEAN